MVTPRFLSAETCHPTVTFSSGDPGWLMAMCYVACASTFNSAALPQHGPDLEGQSAEIPNFSGHFAALQTRILPS